MKSFPSHGKKARSDGGQKVAVWASAETVGRLRMQQAANAIQLRSTRASVDKGDTNRLANRFTSTVQRIKQHFEINGNVFVSHGGTFPKVGG